MKKRLPALFFVLTCLALNSCMHNDHDISIDYKDSDGYYYMKARFSKGSNRKVERYMDDRIGRRSHMSFVNSRIDGTITLDDHAKFYLKKYPGYLEIKLDKDENAVENYDEIKSMCQGLKTVLTK